MVGCSDKDVVEEVKPVVTNSEDGKQFIALDINLPVSNTATRSETVTDDNNYEDGNFELNDGMESEYTVNDATLIVFHPATGDGKTEYDATFVAAYEINPEPWKMSNDHQVTDYSTKIVQKVGTTVNEGDLALVILNKNKLLGFNSNNAFVIGDPETTTTAFSGTFKKFQESLVEAGTTELGKTAAIQMTTTGFFMANSPLTDKAGSQSTMPTGAKLQTLVTIKNVYETEEEARDGECAEIYVERGMAKVTVDGTPGTSTLTTQYNGGATAASLNITIDGWTLDNTNSKSFFVRSTESHTDFIPLMSPIVNKYRYIGKSEITEGNPETYKYRTYFAKDPNYEELDTDGKPIIPTEFGNSLGELKVVSDLTADGVMSTAFGETNPQYCYENTFDVAHQSVNNTTLVRLKVTLKTGTDAEDLYIVNGNKSTIYKNDDVITLIQNKALEILKAAGVKSADASNELSSTDFEVTLGTRTAAGYKNISAISFTGSSKVSSETTSLIPSADDLLAAVKLLYKDNDAILCYAGGVSYYTIRIKHFGDQLTPWKTTTKNADNEVVPNPAETPYPSLATHSYPNWNSTNADEKAQCDAYYLGRYGVLRNNWYDIKINSIKYLGEAVPTNYSNDPTPDDELDGYIAVQINILSWAKRTQSWDL